jgi:hypothetical protein
MVTHDALMDAAAAVRIGKTRVEVTRLQDAV